MPFNDTKTEETVIWTGQDHDLLIRIGQILTDVRIEIRDIKDNVHIQIADHERRIKYLEDLVLQVDPLNRIKNGEEMARWIDDFRSRWKVYAAMGLFISGIGGAILIKVLETLAKQCCRI